jgi:hypothetical protein
VEITRTVKGTTADVIVAVLYKDYEDYSDGKGVISLHFYVVNPKYSLQDEIHYEIRIRMISNEADSDIT